MPGPMREEICRNCGKKFMTDKNAQKHCSEDCRREFNGKKSHVDLKIIECAYCGEKFESFRKCKYCSDICRYKANGRFLSSGRMAGRRRKPTVSISEISRLARDCGLSYGEYVAKYNC